MKKRTIAILGTLSLSFIAFLWLGNNNNIEPLDECKSNEELKVYCDFMNPEDLALTPDGNFLIASFKLTLSITFIAFLFFSFS